MTEIGNLNVTATAVEITSKVEIRCNGHLLDTVDVDVLSSQQVRRFSGQVIHTTAGNLLGVDLDELKKVIEERGLHGYSTGRY